MMLPASQKMRSIPAAARSVSNRRQPRINTMAEKHIEPGIVTPEGALAMAA
jgi:hypothetical protein